MPNNYCLAIQDDNGNTRAYIGEAPGIPNAFWIYSNQHQVWGMAYNLDAAISMAREKTGLVIAELPEIRRSEITIKQGEKQTTNGFQGGGFYRHDSVYLKGVQIGSFYQKQQPARRVNTRTTCNASHGILGWDLTWLVNQHGYRLVDDNGDYANYV